MREVKIQREVNDLLDHYTACFRDRYGRDPLHFSPNDQAAIKYSLQRVGDYDILKSMIQTYLSLSGQRKDDYWFKEQGHDLATFKNKISFLLAKTAEEKIDVPVYVVGFTETGHPITSKKAVSVIPGFVPVELHRWQSFPTDKKYIVAKSRWVKSGANVVLWENTWRDLGK